MPECIFKYFPSLSENQKEKISGLLPSYSRWNKMINVISRKDMDSFYVHHVLHSLAIAKVISFKPGTNILDAGTGGGFPGIPLAIMFPDANFTLIDSIGKKIRVVSEVADELQLKNVITLIRRIENEAGKYDFVISRAVTEFRKFAGMTVKNISKSGFNTLGNGILYLKGGDLDAELASFGSKVTIWNISKFYSEPFFETKKIVYLPA
jgi:16S rRNA (guanine527-N7)-methyltransferase